MSHKEKIRSLLNPELLEKSGSIIYSDYSSLKKNDFYILGTNPGGEPNDYKCHTIGHQLEESTIINNAYYEKNWTEGDGKHRLQENIKTLEREIIHNYYFATNLIFQRTHNTRNIDIHVFAEKFWKVHEYFLLQIKPKVIIAFGNSYNSAYGYLKVKANIADEEKFDSGHGKWKIKYFFSDFVRFVSNLENVLVIGFPHLSRYSINKKIERKKNAFDKVILLVKNHIEKQK